MGRTKPTEILWVIQEFDGEDWWPLFCGQGTVRATRAYARASLKELRGREVAGDSIGQGIYRIRPYRLSEGPLGIDLDKVVDLEF